MSWIPWVFQVTRNEIKSIQQCISSGNPPKFVFAGLEIKPRYIAKWNETMALNCPFSYPKTM